MTGEGGEGNGMPRRRRGPGGGRPKAALEVLGEGSFGAMLRRARRLQQLQERLALALPADLAAHCRVVGLDDGHLRLLVSSSMRATQLRYHKRQLLDALARRAADGERDESGEPVSDITFSVCSLPGPDSGSGRSRRPIGISPTAAQRIEEAARTESDPALREALLRLAGRRR